MKSNIKKFIGICLCFTSIILTGCGADSAGSEIVTEKPTIDAQQITTLSQSATAVTTVAESGSKTTTTKNSSVTTTKKKKPTTTKKSRTTTTTKSKPEPTGTKYIALSFDDGPNLDVSHQTLDKLETHDVPATFFLIGVNISDSTVPTMKRANSLGCELANHSLNHSEMDKMTVQQIKDETDFVQKKIKSVTGKTSKFFRPPMLKVSSNLANAIYAQKLTMVSGISADDWAADKYSAGQIASTIVNTVQAGDIILLHDSAGAYNTPAALDTIIPVLKNKGYVFVTVSQLFSKYNVTPKKGYMYTNVLNPQKVY